MAITLLKVGVRMCKKELVLGSGTVKLAVHLRSRQAPVRGQFVELASHFELYYPLPEFDFVDLIRRSL